MLMLARAARRAVLARALSADASRGRELAGQGRLREAADAFRTAARAAPARADDHAALGEVLLQLGELDDSWLPSAEIGPALVQRGDDDLVVVTGNPVEQLAHRGETLGHCEPGALKP